MEAAEIAAPTGAAAGPKPGLWRRLWAEQSGLTTVEYALLLMIIVAGLVTIWGTLGSSVSASTTRSVSQMPGSHRGVPSHHR